MAQILRRRDSAPHPRTYVPVCEGTLLVVSAFKKRVGGKERWGARYIRGASSVAASEHVGPEGAALQHEVDGRGVLPCGTRGGGQWKWKRKVLPAAAYLEMARAAIEQACGERGEEAVLELRDVVWGEPLVVEEQGCEVNIALQAEEDGEIGFEIYSGEGERGEGALPGTWGVECAG